MKAIDIVAFLQAHQPKIYWECSEDVLLELHRLKDIHGQRLLVTSAVAPANSSIASGTLLSLPIHVERSLMPRQLALCVLAGDTSERHDFKLCECRNFTPVTIEKKYMVPALKLVCVECGEPSDKYDVAERRIDDGPVAAKHPNE